VVEWILDFDVIDEKVDIDMYNIGDFVRESNRIEGINREPLVAEIDAHMVFLEADALAVPLVEEFVRIVQPYAILRRQYGLDVRVGDYLAPLGGPDIEMELTKLVDDINYWNIADKRFDSFIHDTHLRYERLHPFTDGNGRSGRAIWLWMQGGYAPIGFLHQFYYDTLNILQ